MEILQKPEVIVDENDMIYAYEKAANDNGRASCAWGAD